MHIPVLTKEVLQYLDPKQNENFIDCTANGGGHSIAIFQKIKPNGKLLAIEWDESICRELKSKIAKFSISNFQFLIVNDSYINLEKIVANLRLVSRREKKNSFGPVNGILFDLGMSSWHLESSGRGFTFQKDQPLDMRYSTDNDLTAEYIVNNWSESDIVDILKEYGEERYARRIANNIIKARPIKTTFQLVKAIGGKRGKIHPATRTFQALRIAVNRELSSLEKALPLAEKVLAPGGRLVVISFHSLEDRIVKNFFKNSNLEILFKKPITASLEEIKSNPRARSAKLRAGVKK